MPTDPRAHVGLGALPAATPMSRICVIGTMMHTIFARFVYAHRWIHSCIQAGMKLAAVPFLAISCLLACATAASSQGIGKLGPAAEFDAGADASSRVMGNGLPECGDAPCCGAKRGGSYATSGATCPPSGDWCPDGLLIEKQVLTCSSGLSQRTESCSRGTTLNGRGCPGAQPTNGDACTTSAATVCRYYRSCGGTGACKDASTTPPSTFDGGGTAGTGCVEAQHTAFENASCTGGLWATRALSCT